MKHKPHAGHRKGQKMPFFVPGDLDLWPSNSSERGTKHVFHVNLAPICSVVLEIFHTQTKKTQTDAAKNRTFRSSLCVVKMNYVIRFTQKLKGLACNTFYWLNQMHYLRFLLY